MLIMTILSRRKKLLGKSWMRITPDLSQNVKLMLVLHTQSGWSIAENFDKLNVTSNP